MQFITTNPVIEGRTQRRRERIDQLDHIRAEEDRQRRHRSEDAEKARLAQERADAVKRDEAYRAAVAAPRADRAGIIAAAPGGGAAGLEAQRNHESYVQDQEDRNLEMGFKLLQSGDVAGAQQMFQQTEWGRKLPPSLFQNANSVNRLKMAGEVMTLYTDPRLAAQAVGAIMAGASREEAIAKFPPTGQAPVQPETERWRIVDGKLPDGTSQKFRFNDITGEMIALEHNGQALAPASGANTNLRRHSVNFQHFIGGFPVTVEVFTDGAGNQYIPRNSVTGLPNFTLPKEYGTVSEDALKRIGEELTKLYPGQAPAAAADGVTGPMSLNDDQWNDWRQNGIPTEMIGKRIIVNGHVGLIVEDGQGGAMIQPEASNGGQQQQ